MLIVCKIIMKMKKVLFSGNIFISVILFAFETRLLLNLALHSNMRKLLLLRNVGARLKTVMKEIKHVK